MTKSNQAFSRARFAARLTPVLAALALAAAAPAQASESSSGTALKNTAIAGTIASWAVSWFKGAPFGDCLAHGNFGPDAEWGMRLVGAKDAELKFGSVGIERRECALTKVAGWSLDVSPVASVGVWKADSDSTYAHNAWDVAYVPMMHWRYPVAHQTRLDFEFGIGPSYLSEANIGDRQKSTNFQFSDHFGVGLGTADGHWRVGFAFNHFSNLSIKTPNNAVDFKGIALEWIP